MAARDPLARGARHRAPVDAAMLVKASVLVGEQHREIARVDLAAGDGQAPAPVGQRESAQQPPVAIDDDRRAEAGGGEIERPEALEIAVPSRGQRQPEDEDERADDREAAAFEGVSSHFAFTSIAPKPVRPKRSGRYMSSAVAGG